MHAADWRNLARERAALDEGVRAGKRVVQPYVYQALSSSPASSVLCTTRQIEAAYEGMVQRWMKDSMPEAFEVPA